VQPSSPRKSYVEGHLNADITPVRQILPVTSRRRGDEYDVPSIGEVRAASEMQDGVAFEGRLVIEDVVCDGLPCRKPRRTDPKL
jgi:hypothetical protein